MKEIFNLHCLVVIFYYHSSFVYGGVEHFMFLKLGAIVRYLGAVPSAETVVCILLSCMQNPDIALTSDRTS